MCPIYLLIMVDISDISVCQTLLCASSKLRSLNFHKPYYDLHFIGTKTEAWQG